MTSRPAVRTTALLTLFALAATVSTLLAQSGTALVSTPAADAPLGATVREDGFIHVSRTPGIGSDIAAQTRQVLDTISTVLSAAGSSLAHTASTTVYLRHQADFAAMNEVYRTYWPEAPPARTTVVVPLADGGLIEIAAIAVPAGGERAAVKPAGWIAPPSPYSYGIRSGNTLFLAGLLSRDGRTNAPVAGDVAVQTRTVMNNAAAILEAAGMRLSDVVSSRVYLTDEAGIGQVNGVFRAYFQPDPPEQATATVQLTAADALVEVTMVAVRPAAAK